MRHPRMASSAEPKRTLATRAASEAWRERRGLTRKTIGGARGALSFILRWDDELDQHELEQWSRGDGEPPGGQVSCRLAFGPLGKRALRNACSSLTADARTRYAANRCRIRDTRVIRPPRSLICEKDTNLVSKEFSGDDGFLGTSSRKDLWTLQECPRMLPKTILKLKEGLAATEAQLQKRFGIRCVKHIRPRSCYRQGTG